MELVEQPSIIVGRLARRRRDKLQAIHFNKGGNNTPAYFLTTSTKSDI